MSVSTEPMMTDGGSHGELSSVRDPSAPAPDAVTAFADFLRREAVLDELSLQRAERARRQSGERLDVVLVRLGLVNERDAARFSAAFLGYPFIDDSAFPGAPYVVPGLEPAFLRSSLLLPLDEADGTLRVAVADPFDPEPVAALSYLLDRPVAVCVASEGAIRHRLDGYFGAQPSPFEQAATAAAATRVGANDDDVRRLSDLASEAPVIRLVQDIINKAVDQRASDIHLEPAEDSLRVRLRIDGLLHDADRLSPLLSPAVISRIKVMSNLDIAERRLPQDGRARVNVRGREVDLRVATMPTLKGESVVMRILDRDAVVLDFEQLGFGANTIAGLGRLLQQPNGLILVTGPTGSGKTTTLYAALKRLNQPHSKTFTVEDPIEYQLQGINQIQVLTRIGLTFASALRSILRQDPDIIMVGEIRDLETAEMAVQSALTGHLVLSTVHTNSAASTIVRLLDMGVEDYLLASTVKGILAQRLVRRLCDACARPAPATAALTACLAGQPAALARYEAGARSLRQPAGCDTCRNTGYRGRLGISELMMVDEAVAAAMVGGGREAAVEAAAEAAGMTGMLADGLQKVLDGQTTLDEVLRVTRVV